MSSQSSDSVAPALSESCASDSDVASLSCRAKLGGCSVRKQESWSCTYGSILLSSRCLQMWLPYGMKSR